MNILYLMDISPLEDKVLFDKYFEKMPPARREKVERLRFQKDKCLSLGAGILLYGGLSSLGIRDDEIKYTKSGKPVLDEQKGIYFNLSHSGKMVICAFSDRNIGADTEEVRHFEDSLVKRIFTENEISSVRGERDRYLTRLWTAKESLMKYMGTGLGTDPRKIDISGEEKLRARLCGEEYKGISFSCFDEGNYAVTVCSEYDDILVKRHIPD